MTATGSSPSSNENWPGCRGSEFAGSASQLSDLMAKLRLASPGQNKTMTAASAQINRHCEEFGRHTARFYATLRMAGKRGRRQQRQTVAISA